MFRLVRFLCVCIAGLSMLSRWPAFGADDVFITPDASRHYTRARTYDVHHTRLELTFDHERGTVRGLAAITLSPVVASSGEGGLRSVEFDAVNFEVDSVIVGSGGHLAYTMNDSSIVIQLDRPYTARDTLTLEVAYRASPRRGMYFTKPDQAYPDKPRHIWTQGEMEESRHWYPCWDAPNDLFTSELVATVPEKQMVISNGTLVSVEHDTKTKTRRFHWREDHPHVAYLTSLVAGEFAELKDEWDGIPISSYVVPEDLDRAERSFGKTADMMEFFSTRIGYRYPYAKYTQTTVEDFRWGGMENFNATTLTRRTLHDARYQLDGSSDALVAHELAHQWWGDLLTSKNWNHVWLHEGFATYFDYLYTEHDRGADEFLERIHSGREEYFAQDSGDYRRSIVTDFYENAEQMFDRHTYQKGAQVLHMLRYVLGDDVWWQVIRHYAHGHAHGNVTTEDLRRAVEEISGEPLEWFFDQWLYRGGYPEYDVSTSWNEAERTLTVKVVQTQSVDTLTPLFRMPVVLEVAGQAGVTRHRFEVKEKEQSFVLSLPAEPVFVEFDPEDWILKKLRVTKSKRELIAQLAGARTTASRKRAAEWLSAFPADADAVVALVLALQNDPAWGVRGRAAQSLGEVRTPAARDALLAALSGERESRARQKMVDALGKFREEKAVARALRQQFERDSSYNCLKTIMKSLVAMKAPDAYDACVRGLEYESHQEIVRAGALESLAKLEDPRGVDLMMKWTLYGEPPAARVAAVEALGKIATKVPERKKEIRERLVALLDDPYFQLARTVIDALGEAKDAEAIGAIEKASLRAPDFRTKHRAWLAMTKIRKAGEADAALAAVKEELAGVRRDHEALSKRLELLEAEKAGLRSGDSGAATAEAAPHQP